jgi:hypothetical protein
MANPIKRFIQRMEEEGRAKFSRLASDQERGAATAFNAMLMAGLVAALVSGLYFVLYVALALIFLGDELHDPRVQREVIYIILYVTFIIGSLQGAAAGAILGYGQGLLWQGKRNAAGTVCAAGGAILVALMALYQTRYYLPEIPLSAFILWALILFSPGYLAATCVAAWGLNLLNSDK